MANKELSTMSIKEQIWVETKLKRLSESLRVIERLISNEDEEKKEKDPGSFLIYAHVIKEAREYFMDLSEQLESISWIEQLESINWIELLEKDTQWYEDVIRVAVCYDGDEEQNIYSKVIHEECNRVIKIWNDLVYMLMN